MDRGELRVAVDVGARRSRKRSTAWHAPGVGASGRSTKYLVAVLYGGVQEAWNPSLVVAATFMKVCEQSAGNQRAEAVRLFRELFVLQEKQWQSMHQKVDEEIASGGSVPKK